MIAAVALPLAGAAVFFANLEDRTAEGTQYLLSAMEAATQSYAQNGEFPATARELPLPAWEGIGHISVRTSDAGDQVCVQLALTSGTLAIYSADPQTVAEGSCSAAKLG